MKRMQMFVLLILIANMLSAHGMFCGSKAVKITSKRNIMNKNIFKRTMCEIDDYFYFKQTGRFVEDDFPNKNIADDLRRIDTHMWSSKELLKKLVKQTEGIIEENAKNRQCIIKQIDDLRLKIDQAYWEIIDVKKCGADIQGTLDKLMKEKIDTRLTEPKEKE